jgi:hypothetical protein
MNVAARHGSTSVGAKPLVVAVEMGYGHLRAATALADALETEVLAADRPPVAEVKEARLWGAVRRAHELASKAARMGNGLGLPLGGLMDWATFIDPLHPLRDLARPDVATRWVDHLIRRGLGGGLVRALERGSVPLLTTFYVPALVAARARTGPVWCVVTDADLHRVWVPRDPVRDEIHYLAPSRRAVRRLAAYGVPAERVHLTGFPLPTELLGGPDLRVARRDLSRRLVRLDPRRAFRETCGTAVERGLLGEASDQEGRPPRLVFAVGGAGAQVEVAAELLASFADAVRGERIRISLVAGTRAEVAAQLRAAIAQAGLGSHRGPFLDVLWEPSFPAYYRRFNDLLHETDVLWTKPSELGFYAALGIPIVISPPVGAHERFNRRWLREQGCGLKQRSVRHASGWLGEWLEDGTLAAAAWSGFVRLPKTGTYEILRAMGGQFLTTSNSSITSP